MLRTVLVVAASFFAQALFAQTSPMIRVPVRIVEVPAVATAKDGTPVRDMGADEFRLYDDDRRQEIRLEYADQPLSLAVVVQTNGDVRTWLPEIRRAKSAFEALLVGENGQASLTTFNDTIDHPQAMTANVSALDKAFESLRPSGYRNRCLDAVLDAAGQLENAPSGRRRVILLIAQPFDSGSAGSLADVLRRTELDNITIYQLTMPRVGLELIENTVAIGKIHGVALGNGTGIMGDVDLGRLVPAIVRGTSAVSGQDQLLILTSELGGRQLPFRKLRDLEMAIAAIGQELHTGYVLSYSPGGNEAENEPHYHRIRVETVRPGIAVRARPGYYSQ